MADKGMEDEIKTGIERSVSGGWTFLDLNMRTRIRMERVKEVLDKMGIKYI